MPSPAIELWLELETRCNLTCKFCYNYWKDGSAPAPTARSTDQVLAALRLILERVEVKQVAFSGGEPLLRKDLLQLVRLTQSYNVPATLTTNGVLLSRERIALLHEAGIATFQISLHSHLPQVHDFLTGAPSWHEAMAAMIRVREAGFPMVPVFVATDTNLSHFSKVLRICKQLDVTLVIFNRFIPTGLGKLFRKEIGVPGDQQVIDVLSEADEIAGEYGIRIQLGTPVDVPASSGINWRNIDLASCPVGTGQRRWTMSSDLTLRRCNQSGATIGSVLGEGLDRLLSELNGPVAARAAGIRTCGILAAERLVELR